MAKDKDASPEKADAGETGAQVKRARVLSELGELRSGDLVESDAASIEALVSAGVADDHPDAVAYALETGASIKTI